MQDEVWQPVLPPGVLPKTYSLGPAGGGATGLEAFSFPKFAHGCSETVFSDGSGLLRRFVALGGVVVVGEGRDGTRAPICTLRLFLAWGRGASTRAPKGRVFSSAKPPSLEDVSCPVLLAGGKGVSWEQQRGGKLWPRLPRAREAGCAWGRHE